VQVLEAVPNISEGRDPDVVAAVARAFGEGARVLDVHSDPDHHRSVFTLVGPDADLVESLLAGVARAVDLVDLRAHDGVHPRVGAVDVVPIVPLEPADMERARRVAEVLATRIGAEHGLPVFLYGENRAGARPAFFRRGGPDELQRRIDAGELTPDFGPPRLDPAAGALLVGARPPLVAFNLELATDDLDVAIAIAATVRESGGGMPGVQALGLRLPGAGGVQVSINVIDVDRARLADVVARVRREAATRDVEVRRGELVGLLPERAVAPPQELALEELPDDRVLERRLEAAERCE
jgi:glutamate formiminotransferase / 5-formyltetrahydrofolate cyclo-ligase